MAIRIERIEPRIAWQSLVGVGNERPTAWGNYFGFSKNRYRCVNMWSENLEEWARREEAIDIEVAVVDETFAIVIDELVPQDWLYQECCFAGGTWPTVNQLKEIAKYTDVPIDEYVCGCEDGDDEAGFTNSLLRDGIETKFCKYCKTSRIFKSE